MPDVGSVVQDAIAHRVSQTYHEAVIDQTQLEDFSIQMNGSNFAAIIQGQTNYDAHND